MCGICGVASHWLSQGEGDAFKQLLMVSQLRGPDSTGVFNIRKPAIVKRNGDKIKSYPYLYSKDTDNASVFMDDWPLDDKAKKIRKATFDPHDSIAMVGHCRAATVGDISVKNAHPFDYENVIGVHNGTIRSHARLPELKEFESDSAALYKSINDRGLHETLDRVGKFAGAYSLVYFDKREGTLNFIRNDERPMFFMYTSSGDTLYWASEAEFLQLVAHRRNIHTKEGQGIFSLKPMMLWSIKMGRGSNLFVKDNMSYEEVKINNYTQSPVTTNATNAADAYEWNEAFGMVDTPPAQKEYVYSQPAKPYETQADPHVWVSEAERTRVARANAIAKTYHQTSSASTDSKGPTPYRGFNNQPITRDIFVKALKHGCALCCTPQNPDLVDIEHKIGWADPGLIICPECIGDKTDFVFQWLVNNVNEKPKEASSVG